MKARLVLEDGSVFEGESFGAEGSVKGEVVFNTGMTGYQEILTDPSYCGQIVTMTYPLIGNYGYNNDDMESSKPHVKGFIVRELCSKPSNFRSIGRLEKYLKQHNIIGLEGIDTRALTRKIRVMGAMKGIITTQDLSVEELKHRAKLHKSLSEQDLIQQVTASKPYKWGGRGYKLAVIDLGVKYNILRSLAKSGFEVMVFPAWAAPKDIMDYGPHGLFLTNGPGDPQKARDAIKTVKQLLGKLPIMGICLGHQIIALAMGGNTYKLKFGHRGSNHPVKDLETGKVYITSQNHGFAVDGKTLPPELKVTHQNLNDGTVEGLKHTKLPVFSVQYHPEASPGPQDSQYLFKKFKAMVEGGEKCQRITA